MLRAKYSENIIEVKIENMSREQVRDTIQSCDLLLMTSISEGSPQIIKEGMSCNLPIVSTNVGDVKNLLMDVKNSYVIDSFKPDDFIESILKILKLNKQERISDGRNRINYLQLDSRSISKELFELYTIVGSPNER